MRHGEKRCENAKVRREKHRLSTHLRIASKRTDFPRKAYFVSCSQCSQSICVGPRLHDTGTESGRGRNSNLRHVYLRSVQNHKLQYKQRISKIYFAFLPLSFCNICVHTLFRKRNRSEISEMYLCLQSHRSNFIQV